MLVSCTHPSGLANTSSHNRCLLYLFKVENEQVRLVRMATRGDCLPDFVSVVFSSNLCSIIILHKLYLVWQMMRFLSDVRNKCVVFLMNGKLFRLSTIYVVKT